MHHYSFLLLERFLCLVRGRGQADGMILVVFQASNRLYDTGGVSGQ